VYEREREREGGRERERVRESERVREREREREREIIIEYDSGVRTEGGCLGVGFRLWNR
jgi:hypothetical protein